MNAKKFIGASIAIFATNQATDQIIHRVILAKTYETLQHVWRPDIMAKMWIMPVASFIFALLFVHIFARGYEEKGISEGVRYGITIGLLINGIPVLQQYVVYPVPVTLALQWCIWGMIQYIFYGVIVAAIYKAK